MLPNSADRGTSVGVSGMAMAKYAPHRANALLLMHYLAGKPAQALYSRQTNEYPVNADAEPAAILKSFGPMKPEDLAMDRIVRLRGQALGLVERVQFNEGPSQ